MNEFVLSGPVRRRAELAGDIENAHEALPNMVLDLESLNAAILLIGVTGDQMSRILSIPRQAAEPLTTRDISPTTTYRASLG